jgi:hypothetical protein
MKQESSRIVWILEAVQKEQEVYNTELVAFIGEIQAVKECLTASQVMSRIAPICYQMAIEGKLPNQFYPLIL